jgi:hypothetical protein
MNMIAGFDIRPLRGAVSSAHIWTFFEYIRKQVEQSDERDDGDESDEDTKSNKDTTLKEFKKETAKSKKGTATPDMTKKKITTPEKPTTANKASKTNVTTTSTRTATKDKATRRGIAMGKKGTGNKGEDAGVPGDDSDDMSDDGDDDKDQDYEEQHTKKRKHGTEGKAKDQAKERKSNDDLLAPRLVQSFKYTFRESDTYLGYKEGQIAKVASIVYWMLLQGWCDIQAQSRT